MIPEVFSLNYQFAPVVVRGPTEVQLLADASEREAIRGCLQRQGHGASVGVRPRMWTAAHLNRYIEYGMYMDFACGAIQ